MNMMTISKKQWKFRLILFDLLKNINLTYIQNKLNILNKKSDEHNLFPYEINKNSSILNEIFL